METGQRGTGRDRIVDAALEVGEERGWANVRLYQVAERAGVPLATIGAEFRDPDALANAWFARALAMVEQIPPQALADQPAPERLHFVIMRWFETLAPHRQVTGEMLRAKLYFSHPQHWVPLVFDLSRLIHWFLDAARIASTGRARQLAEIGLTAVFLGSLRVWLRDDSAGSERTRAYLRDRLAAADRLWARLA
ncbi:MAG TPA: TetR/AcrR family transcriptional regulator [Geminicoccaceae bacterium]|jgi:AcrR family transcriptional regulator|nr:TetR/AcrR family transcriptional regulator [Geminicoccaceae bacterium]